MRETANFVNFAPEETPCGTLNVPVTPARDGVGRRARGGVTFE
ncbi:MAG TPA: hypothetical protein VGB79_08835 [Allosphingosinicella sp.]|jgi:hypothetical protein